jgi:integrase
VPLFKDFAEQWFAECQVSWKHSYKITLRTSLDKHVLPAFGASPVGAIKKADVLAFRTKLASIPRKNGDQGLSPARINHIMVPLRMILNEAADRYEFETPYKNIKALRVSRTKVDPFTLDEVQRILSQVRPDFRPYYTVRFFTGMRTGEVHGLRWRYVDFGRRQILIRESFVANKMTDTKTDGSAREIHMSQPVYEALLRQKKATGDGDFVFCNGEGNPLSLHNVTNRVWYPLLRHLELPLRRPYQTRHTAATLWLAAGENPEWIARQMGHSTTEMLFRVYSRYVPNLTRQDGSAFEAVLQQSLKNTQDDEIHGGN